MAAILLRRPVSAVRPFTPILHRDTAQARGLLRLWPLNAGGRLQDLVSKSHLTINPTSTFQWGAHPVIGSCLYLPSGGGTASMLTSGLANVAAPWTFSFWWHRIAGPSTVHVVTSAPGSTTGVRGEQFNNTKALGYTAAGTDRSSGIVADSARAQCITYVQPAGAGVDMTVYVDGVARATMATSGSDLTISRIGNYADAVSLPIYGWYGHIGVWNYAMPADLVSALYEPATRWDLYWTPSRRAYLFTGGATNYSLVLDPASLAITAQAVTTRAARKLVTDPASLTITGQAVTTKAARRLTLDAATYTVAGQAVTTRAARRLTLDPGAVTLTGQAVTLTYTPNTGAYTLTLDPASVSITAQAVTTRAARRGALDPASVSVTGQDLGVRTARRLAADPGAVTVTGQAVGVLAGRYLVLSPSTVTWTGQAVTTQAARRLALDPGASALTGGALGLTYSGAVVVVPLDRRVWRARRATVWAAPTRETTWQTPQRRTMWQ